jgi:tetratricopeptide (TPR) repeat protein/ferredoxin
MPAWTVSGHLTTPDFWRTFARAGVAIPFLFVCGFAAVYFLGSKGFCTYGCPYGGFFAPLDKLAVGRIRVTDACEGCGHCTAVCTSNVRVHEEVREFGMVVDPGCFKCLDCVSVCPKEALYFGFGRPSLLKGPAKHAAPARRFDLTWPEEIAIAAVFAASFFAVRGIYDAVPMLMAAGIAGIVAFLVWKSWRLWRDEHVTFHRWPLKLRGRMEPRGWAFAAVALLALTLTAHSGAVTAAYTLGKRYEARVTVDRRIVFSGQRVELPEPMKQQADRALALYRFASGIGRGGIGLLHLRQIDSDMAWLHSTKLEYDEAERIMRRNIEEFGRSSGACAGLALIMRGRLRNDEAMAYYDSVLREELTFTPMMDELMPWALQEGYAEQAIALCQARLADPRMEKPRMAEVRLHSMRWLSILYVQHGRAEEGIALIRRTLEIEPENPMARRLLALTLVEVGRTDEALVEIAEACRLAPGEAQLHIDHANMLWVAGRAEDAVAAMERACGLAPDHVPWLEGTAALLENLGRGERAAEYRRRAAEAVRRQAAGSLPGAAPSPP